MGKSQNYYMGTWLGVKLENGPTGDWVTSIFVCDKWIQNHRSLPVSASPIKSFTCASAVFRTNKIPVLEMTSLWYGMKCFLFNHWPKSLVFLYLALQNPEVVALRGGLSTILKNVIDCQLSRINEALITTVLHLINHPKTRQYVRADVELEVSVILFV